MADELEYQRVGKALMSLIDSMNECYGVTLMDDIHGAWYVRAFSTSPPLRIETDHLPSIREALEAALEIARMSGEARHG